MKHQKRIFLPGQRILRSAAAVALCLLVDVLRGHQGIPLYSVIAALQCMQPYTKDMRGVARKRVIGTVIGAAWGLLLLLAEIFIAREGLPDTRLHYVLVPLTLILVLYSTVLLKIQETAYFSGVVFLVITINHFTDANPYLFAFNRLLDTVIGVLIASVVNRLHLPRRQNTDTLFVSELWCNTPGTSTLSPFSRVELNRLLDDGAKFTFSTVETQATVRDLLPGVHLRYPLITMDGAALYDMNSLEYIRTVPMSGEKAFRLMKWLRENRLSFFSNSIEQNLLVIRFTELANDGMKKLFEKKRTSPYRNFVRSDTDLCDYVVYLLVLDREERIEEARMRLMNEPWFGEYRVVKNRSEVEGYSFLKIYDGACSQEAMLRELETLMGTKETVTFGNVQGKCDVAIDDADGNLFVRELKSRFEPVDFSCWKTIFR